MRAGRYLQPSPQLSRPFSGINGVFSSLTKAQTSLILKPSVYHLILNFSPASSAWLRLWWMQQGGRLGCGQLSSSTLNQQPWLLSVPYSTPACSLSSSLLSPSSSSCSFPLFPMPLFFHQYKHIYSTISAHFYSFFF